VKVYELLADALVAQGVDVVFGLIGDANMYLVADLVEQHGVRFVAARSEGAAVMMADGYARVSGRCGVATVTQGPGLAVAGNGLTIARQARTPLVLLCGNTPSGDPDHPQDFDQTPFALATAGRSVPLRTPATAARDLAAAFRTARQAPGPVVLDMGMDVQDLEVPEDAARAVVAPEPPAGAPGPPDPAGVALAGQELRASRRPVVLAGRGAEAAWDELVALADQAGAVLATTILASGLFEGHPFDLGVAGGLSDALAREVLGEADLVLAVGAGVNRWTADHGRLFGQARLVGVDPDPAALGRRWPLDIAVRGDAAQVARALREQLPSQERPAWRSPELAERLAGHDPLAPFADVVPPPDCVDPRQLMAQLRRRLPADRTTVVGVGQFGGWPNLYLGSRAVDRSLVTPWEFGSIGVGIGFAVGAAVARPDRPVVAFEGDGSLLTALGELDALARSGERVLVVVLDDSAYGAEVRKLRPRGADVRIAQFPPRDLAAVADALGVRARAACTPEQVEQGLDALLPVTGPSLLHVRVDPDVVQEHF